MARYELTNPKYLPKLNDKNISSSLHAMGSVGWNYMIDTSRNQ